MNSSYLIFIVIYLVYIYKDYKYKNSLLLNTTKYKLIVQPVIYKSISLLLVISAKIPLYKLNTSEFLFYNIT